MSNLSDFFGGGGPSNILRGSTSFETPAAPTGGTNRGSGIISVSTGVFVDAANTYLTQGCRGDVQFWASNAIPNAQPVKPAFSGSGSARINGSGEIIITSAQGQSNSFAIQSSNPIGSNFVRNSAVMKGVVDWEAVEFG